MANLIIDIFSFSSLLRASQVLIIVLSTCICTWNVLPVCCWPRWTFQVCWPSWTSECLFGQKIWNPSSDTHLLPHPHHSSSSPSLLSSPSDHNNCYSCWSLRILIWTKNPEFEGWQSLLAFCNHIRRSNVPHTNQGWSCHHHHLVTNTVRKVIFMY